ncbi:MAG: Ni/Fe hydrogenase subunit alpha [Candidatus Aenigmarchaeota archaeon]|nr:Ni/Fe hydrogenase subunit alpha [Candidatus Aenigmarchaeota archaeon]
MEIKIDELSKVEGHAKLTVKFDEKTRKVSVCSLEVFESPRYFEVLIKGKDYDQVPYYAGRICGICNVAHLIGSTLAVENALGIEVSEQTKMLRELMVLGGVIHSHLLHMYMLALPDLLGYESILDMTSKYSDLIKRGLELKEIGNDIVRVIGGRPIHPITSLVGGFTKLPKQEELNELIKRIERKMPLVVETIKMMKELVDKSSSMDVGEEYMSLNHKKHYAMLYGELVSFSGKRFHPKDYKKYLTEEIIDYSTSKHVKLNGKTFMVGPLARMNIHSDKVSYETKMVMKEFGISFPTNNLLYAHVARAVEVFEFMQRCLDILSELNLKNEKVVKPKRKSGYGVSATEAPRGVLYHAYRIENGVVKDVDIIPPTTQNTACMEDVTKRYIENTNNKGKKLVHEIEKLIRTFDPCFSCSAHFLEVDFL